MKPIRWAGVVVALSTAGLAAGAVVGPQAEAGHVPSAAEYRKVFDHPDVMALRTLFDAYVAASDRSRNTEYAQLREWSDAYYRSRFVVGSRVANPYGGTNITIIFQDRPDRVFIAWVYPEESAPKYTLGVFHAFDLSEADMAEIRRQYAEILSDPAYGL